MVFERSMAKSTLKGFRVQFPCGDLENTVIGSTVFGHMSVWEKAADCVCKRARARARAHSQICSPAAPLTRDK